MQRGAVLILAAATALVAVDTARAVPGGDLGVLPRGLYSCELPGDAGDPGIGGGRAQPGDDFEVGGDSSYRAGGQDGVYLLTGDRLLMTSGPFAGRRFHRVRPTFLRLIDPDGGDGALRCISSLQTAPDPKRAAKCKRAADALAITSGTAAPPC